MPGYYAGWSNLGDGLKLVGEIEESMSCYQQALRIQPTYHVALNNFGNALKSTGKLEQAAAQYTLAVRSSIEVGEGNGHGSARPLPDTAILTQSAP